MESRYSPIDKVRIKDFRNLGDVTISFEKSPIVSLIGENESGKTSIIKAIGVCAMNSDYRYQKDYIRNGTSGFVVAIWLKNGNVVLRSKTQAYNKYMLSVDGKDSEINKVDASVPPVVQGLMGLIEEPETKELLHIRTYEDQLLFVVTPNSTNYKVMYDALKVSEITQAIKQGNSEANELKASISKSINGADSIAKTLEGITIYDLEPLKNVRNRVLAESKILQKLNQAWQISHKIETLKNRDSIINYDIMPINTGVANLLNRVGEVMSNAARMRSLVGSYIELSKLKEIKYDTVTKLNITVERIGEIVRKRDEYNRIKDASQAEEIQPGQIEKMDRLVQTIQSVGNWSAELEKITQHEAKPIEQSELAVIDQLMRVEQATKICNVKRQELEQVQAEITRISNWLGQTGVRTTQCPNCGEVIILEG